jgi:glycosyltransferase involved in cell wall biosynthesis
MVETGHRVDVFTTNVNGKGVSDVPLESFVDLDGVRIKYFSCNKFLKRMYYSTKMKKSLIDEIKNYDVVHLHSVFLWPTWIAAKICIKYKKPYILSPRGMLVSELIQKKNFLIKKFYIKFFESHNLKHAKYIHCTSVLEESELKKIKLNISPIAVIPNGLLEDTESKFNDAENLTLTFPKNGYMLFIGRLNWKKGLDRILLAMSHMNAGDLVIAGGDDGYLERLKKECHDLGLENRVYFIGQIIGKEKNGLIKNSALVILPSYSENFGNTLLEAMSFGKCVACTPGVGLAEIIKSFDAGYILPENPKLMGSELNDIINNKVILAEKGANGRALYLSEFDWTSLVKKFEDLYKKAVYIL